MRKNIILSLTTSALILAGSLVASPVLAEDTTVPASETEATGAHPRINQIENRIDRQEQRVNNLEEKGKITSEQADKVESRLNNQEEQLKESAEKHNGHITKAEQKKLNKKLDRNNKVIAGQKHHNRKEKSE